jgi:penicillin-binding protein 1A
MTMRKGLAKSKNMISIRILKAIGPPYAQQWIKRFGFDADKHPAYLPMALGAGAVTPLQMASAYSVFANGGYRINPLLISRITDSKGRIINEARVPTLDESARTIDARNAFIMTSLLQEVTRSGTAAKAQAALKRPDVYGKTGTTNDSLDAWFAGFQPTMAAVAWMGYDTPRKLGDRETGGGLSLPIWINFMETAIKGVPVAEVPAPPGVVNVGGEWYYDDYAPGRGVAVLGVDNGPTPPAEAIAAPPISAPAPVEERSRILDLFRN